VSLRNSRTKLKVRAGAIFALVGVRGGQLEVYLLLADRFRVVEHVVDDQMVGRLDLDELAAGTRLLQLRFCV